MLKAVISPLMSLPAVVKYRLRGFSQSDKTLVGMALTIITHLASQPSDANVIFQV